mgnify:CR=1 FL=1
MWRYTLQYWRRKRRLDRRMRNLERNGLHSTLGRGGW